MAKIKVIIKRPDEEYGHVCYISDSLENLQKTVEGYVESLTISPKLVMLCNEEGKIMNLPFNFNIPNDFIVGTVIICGRKDDELTDIPIDFAEWKKILDKWNNNV